MIQYPILRLEKRRIFIGNAEKWDVLSEYDGYCKGGKRLTFLCLFLLISLPFIGLTTP